MGRLDELATLNAEELATQCTPAMRAALERYAKGSRDRAPGGFKSFINNPTK
ncbi:hypothetical protein [Nocardia nepalensis]|uniref:hypothetical protein n=1 Tax=Nocardia nepalensis TaxID=3375448 RepID=UPI003B684DB3